MSIHFFAKKVYDEDLCFIRDLLEICGAVASVTSMPVAQQIITDIIKKHGLEAKLQEFADNEHYIVQDIYPSNRQERLYRASELLSISKMLPVSQDESSHIRFRAITCVQKMEFSYDEKLQLVRSNLVDLTGNTVIDDFLIQEYIKLLDNIHQI